VARMPSRTTTTRISTSVKALAFLIFYPFVQHTQCHSRESGNLQHVSLFGFLPSQERQVNFIKKADQPSAITSAWSA
jgi:hypothetical protein